MKPRDPQRRVRVTVSGKPVTRTITPAQIDRYLNALEWVKDPNGPLPDPTDRSVTLARIVVTIALFERRSPGEVLDDIADGKGLQRWMRSRKTWPTW
ncbi:hypothetical protein [Sorangium sp. So ce1153]|uniref:hypothetical protein n=1 Tax=Sorangium sp. So ce1153 TaxID=3133333 RepID=UPI003F5EBDF5